MSCNICSRGSCMTSFHSISEQEIHEKWSSMSDRELKDNCIEQDGIIDELNERIEELEKWQENAFEAYPNIDIDMERIK